MEKQRFGLVILNLLSKFAPVLQHDWPQFHRFEGLIAFMYILNNFVLDSILEQLVVFVLEKP